jgi:hypothetical protein
MLAGKEREPLSASRVRGIRCIVLLFNHDVVAEYRPLNSLGNLSGYETGTDCAVSIGLKGNRLQKRLAACRT